MLCNNNYQLETVGDILYSCTAVDYSRLGRLAAYIKTRIVRVSRFAIDGLLLLIYKLCSFSFENIYQK